MKNLCWDEALLKNEIKKLAETLFAEEMKSDTNEVRAGIKNHGLLSIGEWGDNNSSGFFDAKLYFDKLAQAITRMLLEKQENKCTSI